MEEQTKVLKGQTRILEGQSDNIGAQNNLITIQNQKIETQVYLEDANRRNNLVILMDNILNQMNYELNDKNNLKDTLSKPLIGRIKSLTQAFQPYRFLEDTTLSEPFSPERGQLLSALVHSGIDTIKTLPEIFNVPFERAYLSRAYLRGAYLEELDLNHAVLRNANLRQTNLANANLTFSDLREANLMDANLYDANLRKANLNCSNLNNANLKKANFTNVDLRDSDLRGVELDNAYLIKAKLEGAKVSSSDFLEKLKDWNVKGHKQIKEDYRLQRMWKIYFVSLEDYYILKLKD